MKEWMGTAAVCLNEHHQLLMVQGEDGTAWAVPSGGLEPGETLQECCIREVREETGYEVEVVGELFVKRKQTASGIRVETHYFEVRVTGGELRIEDPDGIITHVSWRTPDEVSGCSHAYPEDREYLIDYMTSKRQLEQ